MTLVSRQKLFNNSESDPNASRFSLPLSDSRAAEIRLQSGDPEPDSHRARLPHVLLHPDQDQTRRLDHIAFWQSFILLPISSTLLIICVARRQRSTCALSLRVSFLSCLYLSLILLFFLAALLAPIFSNYPRPCTVLTINLGVSLHPSWSLTASSVERRTRKAASPSWPLSTPPPAPSPAQGGILHLVS